MIIDFQHGIIKYPTSGSNQQFLSQSGSSFSLTPDVQNPILMSFADGQQDYLFAETQLVTNAWSSVPADQDVWLYWDLDTTTAQRTFGHTTIEPFVSTDAPTTSTIGQHWFDLTSRTARVWDGLKWVRKIRLFAAKVNGIVITPLGYLPGSPFAGSQLPPPLLPVSVDTSSILFDIAGLPVLKQNNEFLVTADKLFTQGTAISAVTLESAVLQFTAGEPIPRYNVVKLNAFNQVLLAGYNDIQSTFIAMSGEDLTTGETGGFVCQGVVSNPNWNWTTPGASLWVDVAGELTAVDLHTTMPLVYPEGKSPVARVINRHTVFFDQGLGGKGERGIQGPAGDISSLQFANTTSVGVTKLSTTPLVLASPIAVGDNDPRMTNARTPLAHTHPATEVLPTTINANYNGANLQLMLNQLATKKVDKAGDTMTGNLIVEVPTLQNVSLKSQSNTLSGLEVARGISPSSRLMWSEAELGWVMTDSLSVGITTDDRIVKQADLANYVNKDGDTMTGSLFIGDGGTGQILQINSVTSDSISLRCWDSVFSSNNNPAIYFNAADGFWGISTPGDYAVNTSTLLPGQRIATIDDIGGGGSGAINDLTDATGNGNVILDGNQLNWSWDLGQNSGYGIGLNATLDTGEGLGYQQPSILSLISTGTVNFNNATSNYLTLSTNFENPFEDGNVENIQILSIHNTPFLGTNSDQSIHRSYVQQVVFDARSDIQVGTALKFIAGDHAGQYEGGGDLTLQAGGSFGFDGLGGTDGLRAGNITLISGGINAFGADPGRIILRGYSAAGHTSGSVSIFTDPVFVSGNNSGEVTVATGNALLGSCGNVLIQGGTSAANGDGGKISLTAGNSEYGSGGSITVDIGTGTTTERVGGNIYMQAGYEASNPGVQGEILLQTTSGSPALAIISAQNDGNAAPVVEITNTVRRIPSSHYATARDGAYIDHVVTTWDSPIGTGLSSTTVELLYPTWPAGKSAYFEFTAYGAVPSIIDTAAGHGTFVSKGVILDNGTAKSIVVNQSNAFTSTTMNCNLALTGTFTGGPTGLRFEVNGVASHVVKWVIELKVMFPE